MPKYRFECNSCGETFSEIVKLASERPRCPNCGSDDTSKIFSSDVTLQFKGDGFYRTDYGEDK